MKKDIDGLMRKFKIDALYAEGSSNHDATMYYLLNDANVGGCYIKKYGMPAYLIHSPIEREEAKKSRLKLISFNNYNINKIFNKHKDKIKANALLIKMIFDDLGIEGRVAFYGSNALGSSYYFLRQLLKYSRKIKVAYEPEKSLLNRARETKDTKEIEHIKKAGTKVCTAFSNLIKTIRGMKVKDNMIIKDDGKRLLIGDLKAILRKELYSQNLTTSAGLIVAQGRDAGIPHNSGTDQEAVRLGKTIVFDIYPQELGGGYFFDFTRTVCFGYAPKKFIEYYQLVAASQDYVMEKLRVGKRTMEIEKTLCRFFEKYGHKTLLSDPKAQSGYCHSLGHGLGLNVHESPFFGLIKTNMDRIKSGMVFTVEPGLYYPELGFGIRLEDVIYVNKNGKIINLTNYPRHLVVEL